MVVRRLAVCGVALASCTPNFETVDQACKNPIPGARHLIAPSELLSRVACYRRFVDLAAGGVSRPVQSATAAHASYLEINDILEESPSPTLEELFIEDPGRSGFSGYSAFDRLAAWGALDPTVPGVGVWEVFLNDLDEQPDDIILDPYLRDVFFQPLWLGAGYAELFNAEGGTAAYVNMIYAFPPARRIFRPVVYPKNGQTDVPLSWVPYGESADPMSAQAVVGFPITITVGSEFSSGGANPYDLQVEEARLRGGRQGEVPLIEVLPGVFPWGAMQATVILAPIVPLLPATEYTLEVDLVWNMGPRTVKTTFTTTEEWEDTDAGDSSF